MATGSLYGSTSESTGLYGIGAASGGTYFEWFIFQDSATAPATPTGGSWSFSTNTGTAPSGWVTSPPPSPVNQVWVSLAIVDSRNASTLTWSVPGLMSSFGSTVANYITFVATSAPTYSAGRLWYDSTQNALSYYNDITNNTIHIGQETQLKVRNTTGSTIAKGAPVYITSTSSGFGYPLVALAQADTLTKANCIGLANEAIATGADGYVVIAGILNGVNTGTFTVGDVLYLSPYSAGQLMSSAPPTGYAVRIGIVSFANTPNGSIYVHQSNAFAQAGNIVGTLAIDHGGTGATTAAAARTNLGLGTVATQNANSVAITGGSITGITDLAVADGGTGASTAAGALANLGAVGLTDTQTLTNKTISGASNTLTNIGNASLSNSSITVNGSAISLGGSATIAATTPNSLSFGTGLSATGPFNGSAATSVQLQSVGTAGTYGSAGQTPTITTNGTGQITSIVLNNTTVNAANIIGAISVNAANITGVLPITSGGTNASTASGARTNLGLGSIATQDASNVSITGGVITGITDLAIADGGTGASTASDARTNLGLGTLATQNSNSVSITGGSVSTSALTGNVSIANGGTGADNIVTARTNLGLGTIATYNAAVANGAATLDASGYLTNSQIPPSIVSGTSYRGTWNASTNTPTLVSSVGTQGYYYVVSTAGSTTLNGISTWAVGDWAIFNGTVWQRLTQNTIISGGLINNTPIGSTTPSTGNFTVLTENSSPVVVQTDIGTAPNEIPLNQYLGNLAYQDARSIAGQVGVITGTAAAPAITPSTNTNTGIFFPATDTIAFAEGGVEAMRINNAGNLGLGVVPSPWATVNAYQVGRASIYGYSGTDSGFQHNAYFNAGWKYITTDNASQYVQQTGGHIWNTAPSGTAGNAITFTQAMTLNASGNLGIGTSSPAQRLDVNGNFRFANFSSGATSGFFGCADTGSITLNFGGTTTPQKGRIFYSDNSDFFSFSTNSTERMRLDSSGNLIQSAPTTPPTLATNGQMVFNLTSNTNLRVSVRGSDGVTRTANITLA